MIESSGCKEWYHLACVMDPERAADECSFVLRASDETGCGYLIILHLKNIVIQLKNASCSFLSLVY